MKKFYILTALLCCLFMTAAAQTTMNVRSGQVTYSYKMSTVGDMEFATGSRLIVNGKAIKDAKAPVGLMDVVSLPKSGANYRVLLTSKGKLTLVPINADEARWILCRIENKTKVAGGKIQLNLSGGRNLLVDENKYSTGDSVKLCLENNKIVADYPLAENAVVLVISGRHIGAVETVDKYTVVNRPTENTITFKDNSETVKKNVFVIGSGKSELPEVSE